METTTNTTITTAAAWRVALSLTLTDARSFVRTAFELIKIIFAFAYLGAAVLFMFSEDEQSIALNIVGLVMIAAAAVYYNNSKK